MRLNLEKKDEANKAAAESMKKRIVSLIDKLHLGRDEVENIPSGYTPSTLSEVFFNEFALSREITLSLSL